MLFLGSYNTRCMTGVSSFNLGPEYIRKLHKKATKESPGKFTKLCISKKKRIPSKTVKSKLNFGENKSKYVVVMIILINKKKSNLIKYTCFRVQCKQFAGPDTDYGDLHDELGCYELQLSAEEIEEKKSIFLNSLKKTTEEIHEIERATVDQVGTIIIYNTSK